ncbi:amidase family protein [Pikeienuella sp. HZG-20]|uniref:amidase family protein n=1 Tax=Paludibacillus litoralis TaxID=3133267 RepID=UPI0030EE20F9
MNDLWRFGAAETARMVKAGEATAVEATRSALGRIDAVNQKLNAVVRRMDEEALTAAAAVDAARAAGEPLGPLAGVPVTVKENVDQVGHPTTNGLRTQRDLIATEDSPVISNLRRAGAIIIGRTNTPAFSLRWFTRNSLHGATLNPWNPALTPGGSSGGAASATAAGIGAMGHGTDIAGSVRYPAYSCGVQGVRPTQGRVPAWNPSAPDRHIGGQLMAVSGPHARSIEDLRLTLTAMAQPDLRDPWHSPAPLDSGPFARRAALCVAPEGMPTDPAVEAALRDAAQRLSDAGWEVEETPCPPLREPARLQLQLWLAEMRLGGGAAVAKEGDSDAIHVFAEMQKLSPDPTKEDILSALQKRLTLLREWQTFLAERPVLICPVSAEPPFPVQLDIEDFPRALEAQLVQVGLPLMGIPAVSVFTGFTETAHGRAPLGAQLVGARYREDVLFAAATEIEARGPKVEIAEP